MNTIEEVKKKYKELGELIECLEITESIFPTRANWKILFIETMLKKYGYSIENLQAKNRIERNFKMYDGLEIEILQLATKIEKLNKNETRTKTSNQ